MNGKDSIIKLVKQNVCEDEYPTKHEIKCKENNGYSVVHLNNDLSKGVISTFNIHNYNDHSAPYLLDQTLKKMKSIGLTQCECKIPIGSSIGDAFSEILTNFGFMKTNQNNDVATFVHDNVKKINNDFIGDYLLGDGGKITFNIYCKYFNQLAQFPEEKDPFIDVYLSQSVSNQVFRVPLKDITETTLNFTFNTKSKNIISNCMVNIDCFAKIKNKHEEYCVNQAGSSFYPLSNLVDISNMKDKRNSSNVIPFVLRIPASPSIIKGRIDMVITPGCINLHDVQFSNYRIKHNLNETRGDQLMKQYVVSCSNSFKIINPTWNVIKNIHAYEYVSRVRVLPAVMFHVFDIPESYEEYWTNALNICLEREGLMTLSEFRNGKGNAHYVAKKMMQCATLYVNYCKYITDKADKNDRSKSKYYNKLKVVLMESFDGIRPRHDKGCCCGDCEDFGKEEMVETFEFSNFGKMLKHSLKTMSGMHRAEDPALIRLGNIRRKYYIFAALGGVSSATINGDYANLDNMSAHEFDIAIPISYFYAMLNRGSDYAGPNCNSTILKTEDMDVGLDLPILIGEGTGLLEPTGTEKDVNPEMRSQIEGSYGSPFEGLRKMFYYDKYTGSRFYQTITTLFTNEFFHNGRSNCGEFIMAYSNPTRYRNTNSKSGRINYTYGVRFTDITRKSENPCLIAQPEISSPLFNYMKNLQENEHPIQPIIPPVDTSTHVRKTDPVYKLKYTPEKSFNYNSSNCYKFTWYARYDQMTANRIDMILKKAKYLNVKLDVHSEPVSGKFVGGYRITIFVKK